MTFVTNKFSALKNKLFTNPIFYRDIKFRCCFLKSGLLFAIGYTDPALAPGGIKKSAKGENI